MQTYTISWDLVGSGLKQRTISVIKATSQDDAVIRLKASTFCHVEIVEVFEGDRQRELMRRVIGS